MWQDESFPYVQVFTPRNFPRGGVKGLAVAAEPMTAPPNALASGEGLLWLDEGETWTGSWGMAVHGADRRRAAAVLSGVRPRRAAAPPRPITFAACS